MTHLLLSRLVTGRDKTTYSVYCFRVFANIGDDCFFLYKATGYENQQQCLKRHAVKYWRKMLSMYIIETKPAKSTWNGETKKSLFQLDSSSTSVYSWKTMYLLVAFQNSLIPIFRMLPPSKLIHNGKPIRQNCLLTFCHKRTLTDY